MSLADKLPATMATASPGRLRTATWRYTAPLTENGPGDFYTSLDQEVPRKPLVSSRSMSKVYFTHGVGTSRLSKLMRLPR